MMDLKEFRSNAHRLADWMADYLETLESRRVSPETRPGDIKRALPEHPPESAVGFDQVMADFEKIVLPGMTHWDHPAFFAYFPGDHSPASILAEMLTAAMGAQAAASMSKRIPISRRCSTIDTTRIGARTGGSTAREKTCRGSPPMTSTSPSPPAPKSATPTAAKSSASS